VIHEWAARLETVCHADAVRDHDRMIRQADHAVGEQHPIQRTATRCLLVWSADRSLGIELSPLIRDLRCEQLGTALAIEVEI
jgi:hypothetical protein